MSIIFGDTETTGLTVAQGAKLEFQPYIIEACFIRTNNNLQVTGEFTSLIKPPIPIKKEATRVNKITDQMVSKAPTFAKVYQDLTKVFLGCHTFVAHNLSFDLNVIGFELLRLGKFFNFPWPPIHFCTVEQSLHLRGHKLKLSELYQMATGLPEIEGAHRAKKDVMALIECYKWLRKKK